MKNLIAVVGRFGEGKSLKMLELGAKMAEAYHLKIVTNFPINRRALLEYANKKNYRWLKNARIIHFDIFARASELAGKGGRANMHIAQAVYEFVNHPNSIVLFDEVGVFLNSRAWANVSAELLSTLFTLRHENIHLVCAFQNYAQVDKQLRENIQEYVHCTGVSKYDTALRLPRMYARFAHFYEPEKFHKKMDGGYSGLRSWLSAIKVEWSFFALKQVVFDLFSFFSYCFHEINNVIRYYRGLNPLSPTTFYTDEYYLFNCYASANRLDKSKRTINRPVKVSISDADLAAFELSRKPVSKVRSKTKRYVDLA